MNEATAATRQELSYRASWRHFVRSGGAVAIWVPIIASAWVFGLVSPDGPFQQLTLAGVVIGAPYMLFVVFRLAFMHTVWVDEDAVRWRRPDGKKGHVLSGSIRTLEVRPERWETKVIITAPGARYVCSIRHREPVASVDASIRHVLQLDEGNGLNE